MIRQTGITTDNRIVLGGVFPLVGTHGIPLEIVLAYFKEHGRVVDWPEYIGGALRDGHKPRTIKSRIRAAVGDVFGRQYGDAVAERLDVCLPVT